MFKSTDVTIVAPLSVGQTVNVEFDYNGELSEISHVQPSCGCVSKEYKLENGKVIVVYTDNVGTAVAEGDKKTKYPSGFIDFVKSATVYFVDNHDLTIIDGVEQKYNPAKKQQVIYFRGKVQL